MLPRMNQEAIGFIDIHLAFVDSIPKQSGKADNITDSRSPLHFSTLPYQPLPVVIFQALGQLNSQ